MSFVCKICDAVYPTIPEGAQFLQGAYGVSIYRFANGDIHILRVVRAKKVPVGTRLVEPESQINNQEIVAEPESQPQFDTQPPTAYGQLKKFK
jgi:hypothetical protein